MASVRFDQFTAVVLERNPSAPKLDEKAGRFLRDAHLARVADLHKTGQIHAAGPFLGGVSEQLEALIIMNTDAETARLIIQEDPIVKSGQWSFKILPWIVPRGALHF